MVNYFVIFLPLNCLLLYYLYLFQLKAYYKFRYLKHLALSYHIFIFSILFISDFLLNEYLFNTHTVINNYSDIILKFYLIKNILIFISLFIVFLLKNLKNKKIKLKFTSRIFRNLLISNILALFLSIFINNYYLIYFSFILIIFSDLFDLYKYIQNIYYLIKSKKIIKTKKFTSIGITGSNGKTSVKKFLFEMLKSKYKVVITPQNYNTPKGIIYTITKLIKPDTEIAIFEMGARKRNDIKTLCKLTNVEYGILTNISEQHLETFKTIKNVYKTKNEISQFLSNNLCIYTYNNPYSFKSYLEKSGAKCLVGIIKKHDLILKSEKSVKILKNKTKHNKSKTKSHLSQLNLHNNIIYNLNLFAQNIQVNNNFYSFELVYKGKRTKISTALLGQHNILNLLVSSALSLHLNVPLDDIKKTITNLSPVEHRLQLIKTRINILDDSYNCSLESAKNSLEVLSLFPNTRCVCTPGIIEGGAKQDCLNTNLAYLLEKSSDIQIIVGKTNRKSFLKVFHDKKTAYFVDSLSQAKNLFSLLLKDGDCLLLLNDLPDDYN